MGTYVRQFFSADDFSRRTNFDLLDNSDAERVHDYDAVIHLAADFDKHPDGAQQCFETNAGGTRNILRHMRAGSIFIYASTKDVYGSNANSAEDVAENTSTEYCGQTAFEWSKLIGEQYVHLLQQRRAGPELFMEMILNERSERVVETVGKRGWGAAAAVGFAASTANMGEKFIR